MPYIVESSQTSCALPQGVAGRATRGRRLCEKEGGGQRNLEPGADGRYGVDEEKFRWGSRTLHCLKACMGVESSGFTKCLQN